MAIDLKDFKQTKYPNLYKSINKDKAKGYKYLMWIKIDGKLHKKILGHSEHINPKDNLTDKTAHDKINDYKKDYENGYTSSDKMKLDELFKIYFDNAKDTDWNQNKKRIYARYIQKPLGSKAIENIKPMHISKIINDIHKQGLKERTQKTILEIFEENREIEKESALEGGLPVKELPGGQIDQISYHEDDRQRRQADRQFAVAKKGR